MELNKLNGKLQKGSTYMIKDGEYPNSKINIKSSGTKELPITISAENVILSNKTTLKITGSHIIFNGFTFQDINVNKMVQLIGNNIEFVGNVINTLKKDVEFVIVVYGLNNRISNNRFSNFDKFGVLINLVLNKDNALYCLVDNNSFNERKSMNSKNGAEIIRLGDSNSSLLDCKSVIYNNIFNNCNGGLEIVSVKSCKNVLYNNKFLNCEGCLSLRHGKDNLVLYNYFSGINELSGGVRLTDKGHRLYYNTFENIISKEPFTTAICVMNGEVENKLNGYAPVENITMKYNDFLTCENCLSLGVNNKRKSNILPKYLDITNNRFIKCYNMFNVSSKVKGHKNSKITDNKLIKYDQKLNIEKVKNVKDIKQFYNKVFNQFFSNKVSTVLEEKNDMEEKYQEDKLYLQLKTPFDRLVYRDKKERLLFKNLLTPRKFSVEPPIEDLTNIGLTKKLDSLRESFVKLYECNQHRNMAIKEIINQLN